jgi:hypothetical protein
LSICLECTRKLWKDMHVRKRQQFIEPLFRLAAREI